MKCQCFHTKKKLLRTSFLIFTFKRHLGGTFKEHKDVWTKNSDPVILNQNDDVELTVDNGIGLLDNIFIQWAIFERKVLQCI